VIWLGCTYKIVIDEDVRFTPKSGHWVSVSGCRFVPKADSCTAAILSLFDHLVGNRQDARWNCESERFRRAEVDCKFQFGGLQNWQVCHFCAFESPCSVVPHTSVSIRDAAGITH